MSTQLMSLANFQKEHHICLSAFGAPVKKYYKYIFMKWIGVDIDSIEVSRPKGLPKFQGLRFQTPRGLCRYGRSEYKTITVEMGNRAFINWWRDMELKIGRAHV